MWLDPGYHSPYYKDVLISVGPHSFWLTISTREHHRASPNELEKVVDEIHFPMPRICKRMEKGPANARSTSLRRETFMIRDFL
jgi:hypothetical protein